MAYIDSKRIERVIKFDKTVFKEIRDDKDALMQAVIVLIIASVLGYIWGLGPFVVVMVIAAPLAWLVYTAVLFVIAKLFGGKATYTGYLKVLGYAEAPMALGIIPVLGGLVGGIWSLILAIYATRDAHEISMGKAKSDVMIPAVIAVVLALLFSALMIGMMGAYRPPGY